MTPRFIYRIVAYRYPTFRLIASRLYGQTFNPIPVQSMADLNDAPDLQTITASGIAEADLFYVWDESASVAKTITFTEQRKLTLEVVDSAPTNGVAATCALDPAGEDNHILLEAVELGEGGNDLTAEIIIKDDSFSVLTNVFLVENAIEIRAGSKYRMVVSDAGLPGFVGEYVSTYTDTVPLSGKGDYIKVGSATTRIAWILGDDKWVLQDLFIAGDRWESYEDVDTPDLVTTWTPVGAASGSPVVTATPATAAQVYTLINADLSETVIATLLPADEYGPVAAVAETSFTGGTGPTISNTPFLIHESILYVNVGTVAAPEWKEKELDNLS